MKKSKLVRKWAIPGIGRLKLMEKPNGMYYVRYQPFSNDQYSDMKPNRWYAFTFQREFETESGATWGILDRLDGGDL
jgi:hypothetical protein